MLVYSSRRKNQSRRRFPARTLIWVSLCVGLVALAGIGITIGVVLSNAGSSPSVTDPPPVGANDCSSQLEQLQERLLKNYNPLLRPVAFENDTFKVKFGMGVHQIIDISEKEQIMKTNVFLELSWYDRNMIWNPDDYEGLKTMQIPPDYLWYPDIVLMNNADGQYQVTYKSNLLVSSNGTLLWVPIAIYKSSCVVNVKYFPFDQQICELRFSSWTYNVKQLVLDYYQDRRIVSVDQYHNSGSWDLVSNPVEIVQSEDGVTSEFIATMVLRRKSLFYVINLLIPVVLTGFLSVIIFHLPADAGEKVTLNISVLLSISVFLVLFGRILPHTSTIPLISKYVLFTFFVNILTIFFTSVVININYRTPSANHMSKTATDVFYKFLPTILCTGRHKQHSSDIDVAALSNLERIKIETARLYSSISKSIPVLSCGNGIVNFAAARLWKSRAGRNACDVKRYSAYIARQLQLSSDCDAVREEWKFAACLADRLFSVLITSLFIIGTFSVLFSSPYLFSKPNTTLA